MTYELKGGCSFSAVRTKFNWRPSMRREQASADGHRYFGRNSLAFFATDEGQPATITRPAERRAY